jgi:DEAD/DEAH box helicase domain-containing protein
VERLDYEEHKAYVRQCDSEYYTDAISYTRIKILESFDSAAAGPAFKNHGEVQVNTQVVGFKKIKFHTNQNVGSGELMLPEQEMHTTAFWLTLPQPLLEAMPYTRDDRLNGVQGLAHALQAIGTLLMMCDARDLGVAVGENLAVAEDVDATPSAQGRPSVYTKIFEPNIYLYDKYPGGIGFSEPLFRLSPSLLENTRRLILNCPCESGCPSCVGPVGEVGEKGKEVALAILGTILDTSS